MNPKYIPKYFKIQELVPRALYEMYKGNPYLLWNIFDHRILVSIDLIRVRYGKMIANTWYWKGKHQYRGFRHIGCRVGSKLSQHRFGRAIDLVPVDVTASEIRSSILYGSDDPAFKFITAIELDTGWLHIDCRSHDKDKFGVLTFKP